MHGSNDPCDLPRNKYFRHRNRKCTSLVAGVCFGTGGTTGNENQQRENGDEAGVGIKSEDRSYKDV